MQSYNHYTIIILSKCLTNDLYHNSIILSLYYHRWTTTNGSCYDLITLYHTIITLSYYHCSHYDLSLEGKVASFLLKDCSTGGKLWRTRKWSSSSLHLRHKRWLWNLCKCILCTRICTDGWYQDLDSEIATQMQSFIIVHERKC